VFFLKNQLNKVVNFLYIYFYTYFEFILGQKITDQILLKTFIDNKLYFRLINNLVYISHNA